MNRILRQNQRIQVVALMVEGRMIDVCSTMVVVVAVIVVISICGVAFVCSCG